MYTWYMKEMSCLDAWGGGGDNVNLQYEPLEGIVFRNFRNVDFFWKMIMT